MYKQIRNQVTGEISGSVQRLKDFAFIPNNPANTDYANFLKDLANGAELLDAEGNVIDGKAYLESL